MKELIKREFNHFCKKRWLKKISKESDKWIMIRNELDAQYYYINRLIKRYNELFDDKLKELK